MAKVTYKDAGVDLDVYRQSMAKLPKLLGRTYSPRVIPLKDGFAGLFRLDFANKLFARNYEDPVLVSCSDGVGTKLKVACAVGNHKTVGIDLVAMSVNDALCCGPSRSSSSTTWPCPKTIPLCWKISCKG